jgi:hypothetical protein
MYVIGIMERSSPETCAASVIFNPLPKVNNHPFGENSPNLVTLRSPRAVTLMALASEYQGDQMFWEKSPSTLPK